MRKSKEQIEQEKKRLNAVETKKRADKAWEHVFSNYEKYTQLDYVNAMTQCNWADRLVMEYNDKYPDKICLLNSQ